MIINRKQFVVIGAALAAILAGALVYCAVAMAHRPNRGLAAGHFSAQTSSMCSPSGRCDWYGRAWCRAYGPHSVKCHRRAIDRRTVLNITYHCTATGVVDHRYRVVQRAQVCS
jgi:hypothetical protein